MKLKDVKVGQKFTFNFEGGDYTYIKTENGNVCLETGILYPNYEAGEEIEIKVVK